MPQHWDTQYEQCHNTIHSMNNVTALWYTVWTMSQHYTQYEQCHSTVIHSMNNVTTLYTVWTMSQHCDTQYEQCHDTVIQSMTWRQCSEKTTKDQNTQKVQLNASWSAATTGGRHFQQRCLFTIKLWRPPWTLNPSQMTDRPPPPLPPTIKTQFYTCELCIFHLVRQYIILYIQYTNCAFTFGLSRHNLTRNKV